MNVLNYMLLKQANQQPPPGQGGQQPLPPPPQAVAMQTMPAGPGEMPSVEKKYKQGDGDFKTAMQGLNNLIYSLNRRQVGDTSAMRQFDRSKMASMNKQAYFPLFNNIPFVVRYTDKASRWAGRQAAKVQAAKQIFDNLPETAKQQQRLNNNLSQANDTAESVLKDPATQAYREGGVKGLIRHGLNQAYDGLGDTLASYGRRAMNFLGTDYTGTGYLQNWKLGLGLLGAYGVYRMLSNGNEDDARKKEMEELRRMRLEMARQNLYRQY